MKKYAKQIIALLLIVCTVISVAMPTVFANGAEGAGNEPQGQNTTEPVVYQFYKQEWANKKVRDEAAGIKAAYDEGSLNWRYEAANTANQFKPTGSNEFLSAMDSLQYFTSISNSRTTCFIAFRIKSPGAGQYDLTLTHGGRSNGVTNGLVYFVDAAVIDAALGENAKAYADAMADPYVSVDGAYAAFSSAIVSAIADKTAAINVNFYAESYTKGMTAQGSFIFEADKEYVAVFVAGKDPNKDSGSILLNSLTAAYSAEQPEVTEPTEATEPTLPAEGTVKYEFYTQAWAGKKVRDESPAISAAYAAGTGNWRIEAPEAAYQFRPAGSNTFLAAYESMRYFTSVTNYKRTRYISVRIQSPGEGKYDLTFTHGAGPSGVKNGNIYIVDAAVIDAALGENAKTYADAMAADLYVSTEGAYDAYYAAITDAIAGKTPAIVANYYAEADTKGVKAEGSFVFGTSKEYVVVFEAGADSEKDTGDLYLSSLTAVYSEEQPEVVISEDYIFYKESLKGKSVREEAARLKAEFDAGTGNWRVEAADVPGQFRLPTDAASGGKTGQNRFEGDTKALQYYTGSTTYKRTRFIALRIQSPGEGVFDLTLTHGANTSGAERGSVYIVDADVIDAALGANAEVYAEALAQDMFQGGVYETGIYDEYHTIIKAIVEEAKAENKAAIKNINYYNADGAVTGKTTQGRFAFEAGKEYVVIFTSDIEGRSAGSMFLSSLNATYSENQSEEAPEEPIGPQEPEYTEGTYDFYQGRLSGSSLAEGVEDLAAKFESGVLNWRYEAFGGNLKLEKASYFGGDLQSLKVLASKDWWLAMRIKAPSQDGAYDIKMIHGAQGEGAPSGSIYVIPGDTPTKDIFKVAYQTGAAMQADWYYYGEDSTTSIGGRSTTTGSVNLKANEEYIVVFLPTDVSPRNGNACFYLGQLQVTRTGDIVENSGSNEDNGDTVYYEFYDWEHPGHFLQHYRSEEELGKKILKDEINQQYAEGTRNWGYQKSNGFASFSTGTPYMKMTIGENDYFCIKIKSPGTGTYEITYNHFAMRDTSAGKGGIYIVPYEEGMEYATIRDEANFKDPIVQTNYYAESFTLQQSVGQYTAFQEGKEYLVCFNVDDGDVTTSRSLNCYPQSLSMKRIGEYVPEAGEEADDGIVYALFQEKYANMWLTKREGEKYAMDDIAAEYAAGTSNWKFESINGSAYITGKYLRAGVGSEGKALGIRIKSPGTGTYKITMKHMWGYEANAANVGELYIIEAPSEKTIAGNDLVGYLACEPVIEYTSSYDGTRFKRVSDTGTFSFQEGKEYIVCFFGQDTSDKRNTTTSTYMYLEKLVMKRIGDYVEPEQTINQGGVAVENAVKTFSTNNEMSISTVNGHDYVGISTFGETLMVYDIDEWRLVDEVITKINTPRGAATDRNGNFWVGGNAKYLYCYNPYTREGFNTETLNGITSTFGLSVGEDGWLYFGSDITANVYRMNPETLECVQFTQVVSWAKYATEVIQKGDYIYAVCSGPDRHAVVMMDKNTGKVLKTQDITKEMTTARYAEGMGFVSEDVFVVSVMEGIAAFKTETLERISAEEFGIQGPIFRGISSIEDGKAYFRSNTEGLCCYDSELGKAYPLGGDLAKGVNMLRAGENSLVTIDDSRLPNPCLITYGGMGASGVSLMAYNLEDKLNVELVGLIDPGFGYGQELRNLSTGLTGSNEIYIGTMYGAPLGVYNTVAREYSRGIQTAYQSDSILEYNGTMYVGEYTSCCITELQDGQATALFMLNDDNFNQARIHTMAAGDDKIFAGTIPDVYRHGGVVAWYDFQTELTYVVTGPDPEDVYYAKASRIMATNEWYRVTNDELVDFTKEWDADQDGDGVYDSFKGFIPQQSIVNIYYKDGLLYGTSCVEGGSSTSDPEGISAQIFIYDVENFKTLKTIDIRDYFDGFPSRLEYLPSIEADPDISNKHWVVASETLFSFTYDWDTNKVSFKKELSFDMDSVWASRDWWSREIIFQGDYMYVCFDKKGGLCKVNRYDTSDYVQLLSNFDHISQIPRNLTMAEDGNIYYLSGGTNIYVVDVDVTDEELAVAKAVQDAIDLISETVTLADRQVITAARAAYNEMHPALQPYVNNYEKLSEAEIELLRLRIADLGDVTIEDEAELEAIQAEYIALKLEQRVTIDYATVSAAVSKMSVLRAERTTNLIADLGEITLEKEQQVRDARASYMDLSLYERKLVTNVDVLNAAEAALTTLLLYKNEAASVDKKIEAIGFVFFGPKKILDARKAYNKLDDQAKGWVENYGTLVVAEIILVAEYLIAAAAVTGGVLYAIPTTRAKIFKKKAKTQ